MATTIVPLRGEGIFRAAQERIKQYIVAHDLHPGDALPTEPTLARELGISRNSLREALKSLETVGLVETRHGIGTFVGQFSLDPLIAGMTLHLTFEVRRDVETLREMLDVRLILELELVRRAAGRHSPEQLATLDALVAAMEARATTNLLAPDADRAFHEALYAPLGNRVVPQLLHAFWDVFHAVQDELPGTPPDPVAMARHHGDILDAVRAGDGTRAVVEMRRHFAVIARRLDGE